MLTTNRLHIRELTFTDIGNVADYTATNAETFKTPGVYKIKFHYSTSSSHIDDFRGDRGMSPSNQDFVQLMEFFKQVPKVDLVSNEIVIVYED